MKIFKVSTYCACLLTLASLFTAAALADDLPDGPLLTERPAIFGWRDNYPLYSHSGEGKSIVSLTPSAIAPHQQFTIDIRYVAKNYTISIFNPFWKRNLPAPGAIAVFDQNHRFLTDLAATDDDEQVIPTHHDFLNLWEGSIIGAKVRSSYLWRPGVYYIQAIYYATFYVPTIAADGSVEPDFRELFRSNIAKITVCSSNSRGQSSISSLTQTEESPTIPPELGATTVNDWNQPLSESKIAKRFRILDGNTSCDFAPVHWHEGYPLNSGTAHGNAVLLIEPTALAPGQEVTFDVCFEPTTTVPNCFNLFWQGLLPESSDILVYDDHHQFVSNLTHMSNGSQCPPGPDDCINLDPDSYAGATWVSTSFRLPGSYYVQAIYYNFFCGPDILSIMKVADERGTDELFRSNIVKLEVTDPAPPAPAPQASETPKAVSAVSYTPFAPGDADYVEPGPTQPIAAIPVDYIAPREGLESSSFPWGETIPDAWLDKCIPLPPPAQPQPQPLVRRDRPGTAARH